MGQWPSLGNWRKDLFLLRDSLQWRHHWCPGWHLNICKHINQVTWCVLKGSGRGHIWLWLYDCVYFTRFFQENFTHKTPLTTLHAKRYHFKIAFFLLNIDILEQTPPLFFLDFARRHRFLGKARRLGSRGKGWKTHNEVTLKLLILKEAQTTFHACT